MTGDFISFYINEDQAVKLLEWEIDHNKECSFYDDGTSPAPKSGAIGGRFSYTFTQTSLGLITTVTCLCGEKIDLTDYDRW
jgi:hypothetical protein